MQRADRCEMAPLGDAEGLGHVPGRPVGYPDVAHVPVANQDVQRLQRLLDRRHVVKAVDLIEIDMLKLEALQACLDLIQKVDARGAGAVGSLANPPEGLGRNHDLVAGDAQIAQGLPRNLFRQAGGIDIRRIDEVDAGIKRCPHEFVGFGLLEPAHILPDAFAAPEGHGAEAKLRNEQAGLAQCIVTHGWKSLGDNAGAGTARTNPDGNVNRKLRKLLLRGRTRSKLKGTAAEITVRHGNG
ncbi:hypothetical protein CHELA40_13810 [Chelatococcus asaccharovorans]|nr:hypothetical protein CHELA40_13810 [Chelatococcus asaccharovorans]CAH1675473.1 hypothetical protein CHELA17_61816 [Chelatococcus asaccharovorans]